MKRLCIIPARGGSKRIPGKNIKSFLGKPVIEYPITSAVLSGLFDEIMVSTDDTEIADIARKAGAKIPFLRSPETANDTATTAEVVIEVIEKYKATGRLFDRVCCLYPVTPLLDPKRIAQGLENLEGEGRITVLPIVPYSTPIFRSIKTDAQGRAEFNWPEYLLTRSQDLPTAYYDAGQFYWLDVEKFLLEPKLVGSNSGFIILSEMETQDIDQEADWEMAELKFKLRKST